MPTLTSKTPSRTTSTTVEGQQKDGEDQAVLHSSMKCRVMIAPTDAPGKATGSDEDSEQTKGSTKQSRL